MRRFALCSHSLLGEERFRDQTRHVIEFEVLCPDSFLALPGEYVRLFLSEPSYQRMLRCRDHGEIRITAHFLVLGGKLFLPSKATAST